MAFLGVCFVWSTGATRRAQKNSNPDCSDNTAAAFISHGMSAWQHLPPHTQTLMLFYPTECVCVCVCAREREEVSGADTEYIFICMQAHERSVSGEEDKGFFLLTMCMWVTEKETEWEKRDAFWAQQRTRRCRQSLDMCVCVRLEQGCTKQFCDWREQKLSSINIKAVLCG